MASTSPGYGITIRVEGPPSSQPVALATAVITGAGRGIGRAIALAFAEAGADLEGGLETGTRVFDREGMVKVFDHPVARSAGELHVPQFHELIVALLLLGRKEREDFGPLGSLHRK